LKDSSPYFDGETLLALSKAYNYLDRTDLKEIIIETAEQCHQKYIIDALQIDADSSTTKGFFQWGIMSYYEMLQTDWKDLDQYPEIIIDLADWMIDVHRTLDRTRNTAYAYEGIIHAYLTAQQANDRFHEQKFKQVIDEGLYKLTSWQVGGPIPNKYLQNNPTTDPIAVGGIMNHKEEPYLRIDVTQHQMHAIILALNHVYDC
jgi:UDP-N-acetylmuramoyl-tripeptide--D-alanyl-D-alanine ligase